MTECPTCNEDSDCSWRCSECGKPFGSSEKSGRSTGVMTR